MSLSLGIALLCALLPPALNQHTDAVLRLSKGVLSDGESLCPLKQDPGDRNHRGPWGLTLWYQHSPIRWGKEGNCTWR